MRRASTYALAGTLIFLIGGIFAFTAQAQLTPQEAAKVSSQDISVSTDPEVPGPNQSVTITLTSYITDLNRAYISWTENGQTALSGVGDYTFTFTTGNVGQTTSVNTVIALISGEIINEQFSFNPADLDVVWEGADSYTPPFYEGRALPSSEGFVRVLAIPQIQNGSALLPQNDYVFNWKKDDNVMPADSGFGKNAFIYQTDYLNDTNDINITATDNQTNAQAQKDVTIPIFPPKLLMYAFDPINGIDWNHEVGSTLTVGSAQKTLLAIPYFFTPANPLDSDLTYAWTINGSPIDTPSIENMITLQGGTSTGVSNVSLSITSQLKLFLQAEKNLTVNLQ